MKYAVCANIMDSEILDVELVNFNSPRLCLAIFECFPLDFGIIFSGWRVVGRGKDYEVNLLNFETTTTQRLC